MLSGSPVQKKKKKKNECFFFFFLIQIIHQPSSSESFARQRKGASPGEGKGGRKGKSKGERDGKGPSFSATAGAVSRLRAPISGGVQTSG